VNPSFLASLIALTRSDKPIGSLLLFWPVLAALALASYGWPPLGITLVFAVGTYLVRSGGCVLNDMADRHFDGHVARTQERPLAQGRITLTTAGIVAGTCFALAFLLAFLCLNTMTLVIAFTAAGATAFYPFSKRFIPLPQAVLALAFNMGILMAYSALQNQLPLSAWVLYAAGMLFTLAYDTLYAMVDEEDDRRLGLHSSAVYFGKHSLHFVAGCHVLGMLLLIALGLINQCTTAYYLGLAAAAALLLYLDVRCRQHKKAFYLKAFKLHHIFWLIVAVSVLIQYSLPNLTGQAAPQRRYLTTR
jgi:4-hydroxybenzoate polyprenyltransferase